MPGARVSRCWLCGSEESREFLASTLGKELTSTDLKISDAHYGRTPRLVECRRCGFRYADPLPAPDLVELYSKLVDEDYREGSEGRIRPFRAILRRAVSIFPEARTVLDIGAGIGLLCLAARELGLQATGVEPSQWAAEVARGQNQVEVLKGIFPHPDLEGRRFDVVTLIDVIEHVGDPTRLLSEVSKALVPGGVAVITTPDAASLAARVLGRRWWHYRVAHICFFDRKTMELALHQAGLNLHRKERYRWVFSVGYLAERLERYLPVGLLRRVLERSRLGRRLSRLMVPVNLRDSWTFYARKPVGGAAS